MLLMHHISYTTKTQDSYTTVHSLPSYINQQKRVH